ncbi:hypothetical protein [Streptomyces werraensis]
MTPPVQLTWLQLELDGVHGRVGVGQDDDGLPPGVAPHPRTG